MDNHVPSSSSDHAQANGAPKNSDPYNNALHRALEVFVSYTERSFDDVMSNGLYTIADTASIDRLLVCRVFAKERNSAGEVYRWDRVQGGTAPINEELSQLPITTALKRWVAVMLKDNCVSLRRSEFLEDEAAFLTPHGVMSILIVPVFTEGDLWGVVTFHDNKNERDFDEGSTSLLRSVARLCVSTIIREEKTRNLERAMENLEQAMEALRHREMMTNALNKASVIFLSDNEKQLADMMNTGVRLIADMADVDRLILFRNHATHEELHVSQVYRWDRAQGGTAELRENLTDRPFAEILPNLKTLFAENNAVNSPVMLLPDPERSTLQAFDIKSAAAILLHINNDFWGFAIFADSHKERYFEDDVVEMLRSAAFLFANTFIRAEVDYDALTGIYNRQYFDANAKRIIKHHSRAGDYLSLMLIDIDYFKQYNDTYGHVEGDKCLKTVAQTLAHCLKREDDFVARYGGDEFVVVMPNTHEKGAQIIADKMLNSVRSCRLPHAKSEAADYVTISIGVTTSKVLHTDKVDDLVKMADMMLYKSKKDGRNRYSFDARPLQVASAQ